MVAAQGGPSDFIDRWPDRLPAAPVVREVPSFEGGYVSAIDAEQLGLVVVRLGGGRLREADRINPSVGLADLAGLGDSIGRGQPLAMIHAATEADADAAVASVQAAYSMAQTQSNIPALIHARIG
jgi:thymidine phosphorylase